MINMRRFFIIFSVLVTLFFSSFVAKKHGRKFRQRSQYEKSKSTKISYIDDEKNYFDYYESNDGNLNTMRRMVGKKHGSSSGGNGDEDDFNGYDDDDSNGEISSAATDDDKDDNSNGGNPSGSDDFHGYDDDDSNEGRGSSTISTSESTYDTNDNSSNQDDSGGSGTSYNSGNSSSTLYDGSYSNEKTEYAVFTPNISSNVLVGYKKGAWSALVAAAVIMMCVAGIAWFKKVKNKLDLAEKLHPLTGTVSRRMDMFSSFTSDLQEPTHVQKDSDADLFVRI